MPEVGAEVEEEVEADYSKGCESSGIALNVTLLAN